MIKTDEKGYAHLECGCRVGRLMTVCCKNHSRENPPAEEATTIRRIELLVRHRKQG